MMKYKTIEDQYAPLLSDIQSFFKEAEKQIWDKRNKIKIFIFAKTEVAAKSFKVPHLFNRFVYTFFRAPKAEKSYENSLKIIDFVPKPLGYATFNKNGLLHESYFLSENYAYDFTIREPLTQDDFENKKDIFKAFAYFTYTLHNKDAQHLDYSPGNILIQKHHNEYSFKVIDVNRMRFKKLSPRERVENFSKLWASDEDLILIVTAYAICANIEVSKALSWALKASHVHKRKKNFKKRLRGQDIVN